MQKSDLRSFFAKNYPHLTEKELDTCCTNMRAFVRVVQTIMEREQQAENDTEITHKPDSTP